MLGWFYDVIGMSERNLHILNGFVKLRENEDEIEFKITPLGRINIVFVERNGDRFNLTFYRNNNPVYYRADVRLEDVRDELCETTGVMF